MQWLKEWSAYFLPAISNLVLVLLGVWMSLPNFAEDVERNRTWRRWLAGICLIFGLTGFVYDVSQRRGSDITNKALLQSVGTTLGNTNSLLTKLSELEQTDHSLLAVTQQLSTLGQPPAAIGSRSPASIAPRQLGSLSQPPASISSPSASTPSQQPSDLRERVLLLAKDTLEFLSTSLRSGVAPTDPRLWSTFVDKFSFRINPIRDELASAGLSEFDLFDITKMHASGDIAASVRQIGDALSDLGSFLPPAGLYKDNSDAQLGEAMIQKANVMEDMANRTLQALMQNAQTKQTNPDFIRYDLFFDFNKCCREAVKDLRGVAIQRLPGAVDQAETEAFLALMHMRSTGSYNPIHEYAPYLRQLGEELKSSPHK
jgi:hypothetical protein